MPARLRVPDQKWFAQPTPSPYSMEVHNLFGWAMLEADHLERACCHLSRTKDRPASFPWAYFGNKKTRFAEALVKLKLA